MMSDRHLTRPSMSLKLRTLEAVQKKRLVFVWNDGRSILNVDETEGEVLAECLLFVFIFLHIFVQNLFLEADDEEEVDKKPKKTNVKQTNNQPT